MSFRRHKGCIDSGVKWLGDVPSHWDVVRLRRLVEIKKDIAGELGYDVFSVTQNGFRIKDTESGEGQQSLDYSKYQFVRVGQFGMNPMDLLTGGADIATTDGVTSPDYRVFEIRNVEEVHDRYMLYMLQMLYRNHIFYAFGQGSSQLGRWRLPRQQFNDFQFPVPPLDEQKSISSFLDVETSKIDGLVSEQRRLIELLKEKRQAVISHAVTKGLNPNAPMKPSGIQWLGDVPQHWEVQRLKHAIISIEQGWSPQCEIAPVESDDQWGVLKVGCVNYGRFTPEENKALPPTLDPQPELGIREGDLLISRANTIELVGSAAVAERDYDNLMLCDKLYRLRMDRSRLLPRFLCYFLTCEVAREPIELGATGASPSMKNIAQSVILELWFAAPDLDEQKEIVKEIRERWDAITTLIAEAERAIELLQERRTALISAAVTGKIDVRQFAHQETP